jgi:hypothetical protein
VKNKSQPLSETELTRLLGKREIKARVMKILGTNYLKGLDIDGKLIILKT